MEATHNLSSQTDAALVAAANGGDEAAFEALYYRHRDWVVNLAYRWTGDHDLALDVMQETFFALAKKFPGFQLTAKLQTFLYPVIRNLAVSARRKAGPSQAGKSPEPDAPQADPARDGDEALHTALAALGPEHRDVLLLRFVDDLSLVEVADILGIPLGTVKSRLHHALKQLRENPRTKEFFTE
jgi:RNA polymerase sigma-70 factor (ECF subfamily)